MVGVSESSLALQNEANGEKTEIEEGYDVELSFDDLLSTSSQSTSNLTTKMDASDAEPCSTQITRPEID